MEKIFKVVISSVIGLCVVLFFVFGICGVVNPSYDEEVAFKMKPWFFGTTMVNETPANSLTFYAPTTTAVYFNILPQKKEFKFDDLLSNDNTPLDVNMYLIYQIRKGETPSLLQNYGENWYGTFIEPYFRNKVREYVSSYSPFDLMSNREVLKDFDSKIMKDMQNYITKLSKSKGTLPIEIMQVTTDRVMPNKEQLAEMNKTAASIQAKQTQEKKAEMEATRALAEKNRAIADKAYMEELDLSPEQFINLKWIETINSKQGANIDVMVGPATSMWNVRR